MFKAFVLGVFGTRIWTFSLNYSDFEFWFCRCHANLNLGNVPHTLRCSRVGGGGDGGDSGDVILVKYFIVVINISFYN